MDRNEITEGLDRQQINKMGIEAAQKAKKFYEDNVPLCSEAYAYYQEYEKSKNSYVEEPTILADPAPLQREAGGGRVILVLTSTKIEEGILLRFFSEQINNKPIPSYTLRSSRPQTYHIVKLDDTTIVHTFTDGTGDESMRRAINNAARIFHISYIILLGICYGIDHDNQTMCSPIIADNVVGYRINFRDEENGETQFVPEIEFDESPDSELIGIIGDFIRGCAINGQLLSHNKNQPISPEPGKILSANCLMSSSLVKQSVIKQIGNIKPYPMGGEMEACGIFKSSIFDEQGFEKWLVIKSICDWGAGKNSLYPDNPTFGECIKNSLQALAMINTCEVFRFLLDHGIFAGEATK